MSVGELDPGPLLGSWKNTQPEPRGMAEIVLARHDGGLAVRVFGAGPAGGRIDWGEIPGAVFAHDAGSRHAMAFSAAYDFGFLYVELQANVKQGVLVVASFNQFRDDSRRSSYFTRELFYR